MYSAMNNGIRNLLRPSRARNLISGGVPRGPSPPAIHAGRTTELFPRASDRFRQFDRPPRAFVSSGFIVPRAVAAIARVNNNGQVLASRNQTLLHVRHPAIAHCNGTCCRQMCRGQSVVEARWFNCFLQLTCGGARPYFALGRPTVTPRRFQISTSMKSPARDAGLAKSTTQDLQGAQDLRDSPSLRFGNLAIRQLGNLAIR